MTTDSSRDMGVGRDGVGAGTAAGAGLAAGQADAGAAGSAGRGSGGVAAIVPVAGLSSRMGDFKPLMRINGFPMIRLTVQSLLDGGVDAICVVCGREAESVKDALGNMTELGGSGHSPLQAPDIVFAENVDFASTDMLASIRLGLRTLITLRPRLEATLLLTGDMPGISPKTVRAMVDAYLASGSGAAASKAGKAGADLGAAAADGAGETGGTSGVAAVGTAGTGAHPALIQPSLDGSCGHPILFTAGTFGRVLDFEDSGGLKAALASGPDLTRTLVETDDPGILMDADTPQAFDALAAHIRSRKGISKELVDAFLDEHETYHHIRNHCRAVGEMSVRMARHLNVLGYAIDTELCRSAACLHDMNRLHKRHSQEAARHLRAAGLDAVAAVVSAHDAFLGIYPRTFTESAIICATDKLCKETELVSLDERYAAPLRRFPETTKAGRRIRLDRDICQAVVDNYEKTTGDLIYT